MAEGGKVGSGKQLHDNIKGVHKTADEDDGGSPGRSDAGEYVDKMNYSHYGYKTPSGQYRETGNDLTNTEREENKYLTKKAIGVHERVIGQQSMMPKPKLMAHGGEVDDDSSIHDALGEELMGALDKKDKKGIMSCIRACVMSCMNEGDK
jgi:hypothetical protein